MSILFSSATERQIKALAKRVQALLPAELNLPKLSLNRAQEIAAKLLGHASFHAAQAYPRGKHALPFRMPAGTSEGGRFDRMGPLGPPQVNLRSGQMFVAQGRPTAEHPYGTAMAGCLVQDDDGTFRFEPHPEIPLMFAGADWSQVAKLLADRGAADVKITEGEAHIIFKPTRFREELAPGEVPVFAGTEVPDFIKNGGTAEVEATVANCNLKVFMKDDALTESSSEPPHQGMSSESASPSEEATVERPNPLKREPEIIELGETRDPETAAEIFRAANQGHGVSVGHLPLWGTGKRNRLKAIARRLKEAAPEGHATSDEPTLPQGAEEGGHGHALLDDCRVTTLILDDEPESLVPSTRHVFKDASGRVILTTHKTHSPGVPSTRLRMALKKLLSESNTDRGPDLPKA